MSNKKYEVNSEREMMDRYDKEIQNIEIEKEKLQKEIEYLKRIKAYSDKEWDKYKRAYDKIDILKKKIYDYIFYNNNQLYHELINEFSDDEKNILNITNGN